MPHEPVLGHRVSRVHPTDCDMSPQPLGSCCVLDDASLKLLTLLCYLGSWPSSVGILVGIHGGFKHQNARPFNVAFRAYLNFGAFVSGEDEFPAKRGACSLRVARALAAHGVGPRARTSRLMPHEGGDQQRPRFAVITLRLPATSHEAVLANCVELT